MRVRAAEATTAGGVRIAPSRRGIAPRVEFGGEEAFEIVKIDRIELPETLHPDGGGAECVGFELAPDHAAAAFARDEARIGQHGEVLGNRRERHLEGFGHIGDGHVIFEKHGQDRPAGRVGEGGESGVERPGHQIRMEARRGIVNQMVEYGGADAPGQTVD
jgi:hypothetical protein